MQVFKINHAKNRPDDDITLPTLPFDYEKISWTENLQRRISVLFTEICLLFLMIGVIGMFIYNGHFVQSMERSPTVIKAAFDDTNNYIQNSKLQLKFLLGTSIDLTLDEIDRDLTDAEELIGQPIKRILNSQTGIDLVKDELNFISTASRDVTQNVSELLNDCQKVMELIDSGQTRLRELRRHIETTIRQCQALDKPLCDTLESTSLNITFNVNILLSDPNLSHLEYLIESSNFTTVIEIAQLDYNKIPQLVVENFTTLRRDVIKVLSSHRLRVYDSVHLFDDIFKNITGLIDSGHTATMEYVKSIDDWKFWCWCAGISSCSLLLIVWLLTSVAICCGCCGSEENVKYILHFTLFILSFGTIFLWALTIFYFVIGGHFDIFICKPLYEDPHFETLHAVLDRSGIIFGNDRSLCSNVLNVNQSFDIPINKLLRNCQHDTALYSTFQMHKIYNIDNIIDHHQWVDLHSELYKIQQIDANRLQELLKKTELQNYLYELLHATEVNFLNYRNQLTESFHVTGKDLPSFAKQLQHVSSQVRDLITQSRLRTLTLRVTKLIDGHVLPLQKLRDRIVYQLASLQIQMTPLQVHTNQTLRHLEMINNFVTDDGPIILKQKSQDFTNRLIGYLGQFQKHVTNELHNNLGRCTPLWVVFDSLRSLACKHVMDPLNGFWFCSLMSLLILTLMSPILVNLVRCYKNVTKTLKQSMHTDSHMTLSETPSASDNTWQTPTNDGRW